MINLLQHLNYGAFPCSEKIAKVAYINIEIYIMIIYFCIHFFSDLIEFNEYEYTNIAQILSLAKYVNHWP